MLGAIYVDQGFRTLVWMSLDVLMRDYQKLDPGENQYWNSLISFPWSIKILYGLISDSFPIYGSRKRAYIMLGGLLQFFCLQVMFWVPNQSIQLTAVCGFLVNLSTAFADVIVDSMMVMQSRRDPVNGSERLQSFSWLCKASGGVIATVITSFMTEYLHPRWCFLFYSVLGLPVFFSGMCLNK